MAPPILAVTIVTCQKGTGTKRQVKPAKSCPYFWQVLPAGMYLSPFDRFAAGRGAGAPGEKPGEGDDQKPVEGNDQKPDEKPSEPATDSAIPATSDPTQLSALILTGLLGMAALTAATKQ